jgi:hypothetical protein
MHQAQPNNSSLSCPESTGARVGCAIRSARSAIIMRCYSSRRRGAAYVFVISLGMLLAAVCYGLLAVSRLNGRSYQQARDTREAEVLAESAVQRAAALLAKYPTTWRTTYTNNVETAQVAVGRGTVSFKLVDEVDGNLSNNTTDPVRVYGYGRVGTATKVYSVVLTPGVGKPYTCLGVAADCGGGITFLALDAVAGSATISTNASITATSTAFNATNLEAVSAITLALCTGTGTRTFNVAARTFPDATVFDWYKANGTVMSGLLSGGTRIQYALISPTSNPYTGGTNAKGIYVINCGGNPMQIDTARIVGTLVMLNTGGVTIMNQINWEPAVTGLPCLLVEGNITWNTTSAALSETSAGINFNPSSTPYPYLGGQPGGTFDTNTTGTFPCQINGLVYCTGNLSTSNNPIQNKGVLVVGGTWSPGGTINLNYDPSFATNPPWGFGASVMLAQSGTWRWETAP